LNCYLPIANTAITASKTLFKTNMADIKTFNNNVYGWTYRGAYLGSGVNKGWKLALARKNIRK